MVGRYRKISRPDQEHADPFYTLGEGSYIERLDGRNPLYKHFKFRIHVYGRQSCDSFLLWANETFGPCTNYNLTKLYVQRNQDISNVKWVLQTVGNGIRPSYNFYFNKEAEVMIRLKFTEGANC